MTGVAVPPQSRFPDHFFSQIVPALQSFQQFPYENLSKIRRHHLKSASNEKLRTEDVFEMEKIEQGMGGTCFSLTYALKQRLSQKGVESKYIMGDKWNQKNIHCALVVEYENLSYLLDPGYMIYQPLELPHSGNRVSYFYPPNHITLENDLKGWKLFTGLEPGVQLRFHLRKNYPDENQFFEFWKNTFSFPMMKYPVLNCLRDGVQLYLQKNMLIQRSESGTRRENIPADQLAQTIHHYFKLNLDRVAEALKLIQTGL